MANEGETRPRGDLAAEKNAPAPARSGVAMSGTWVTARYQDGTLTLSVGGSATYGNGLTAGTTREIEDEGGRVEKALTSALEACGQQAEDDAMEAAYEARALARRRGQEGV